MIYRIYALSRQITVIVTYTKAYPLGPTSASFLTMSTLLGRAKATAKRATNIIANFILNISCVVLEDVSKCLHAYPRFSNFYTLDSN